MTLGERIKKFRQRVGLSQEELAEKLNVSRQAITKWDKYNATWFPDRIIFKKVFWRKMERKQKLFIV